MKIWPGMTEMPMLASYKLAMEADGYHDKNQLMVKFPTATKSTIDLLNRLLTYDPDRRCTVDQSLKHDYFSEPPQMKDKRLLPTFPDNRGEQYKQMQRAAEVSASIKAVKDVKQLKDQVNLYSFCVWFFLVLMVFRFDPCHRPPSKSRSQQARPSQLPNLHRLFHCILTSKNGKLQRMQQRMQVGAPRQRN